MIEKGKDFFSFVAAHWSLLSSKKQNCFQIKSCWNQSPTLQKSILKFAISLKHIGFFFSPSVIDLTKKNLHNFEKYKCYRVSTKCLEYCKVIDLLSCLVALYWWCKNVKVAGVRDVKIRIYCPESLEQFYQKPIPLWHFFPPINQRGEIYQWTVVRDRWAEGWEGQQRFFTGPPRHIRSPTFSPLWIGLLLTGWAFNLFHTVWCWAVGEGVLNAKHLHFCT